jgi:hypothetical protein
MATSVPESLAEAYQKATGWTPERTAQLFAELRDFWRLDDDAQLAGLVAEISLGEPPHETLYWLYVTHRRVEKIPSVPEALAFRCIHRMVLRDRQKAKDWVDTIRAMFEQRGEWSH